MRSAFAVLQRYWFLAAVAVVAPAGMMFPALGRDIASSSWALPALVASTLSISGFLLDTSRLARQWTNARPILLALGSTYVASPLLGLALARVLGPPDTGPGSPGALFVQSIMLAAAQASTLASALAFTMLADGDQELALVITVVSNALTVVATPLVLWLSIGATVHFPVGAMISRMALVVLVPVVAGQVVRRLLWSSFGRFARSIRLGPQYIMLTFIYTGFSNAGAQLRQDPIIILRFFVACAALHLALLGAMHVVARALRLDDRARTAVLLCGSQKTLPNGIYLWKGFFASNPYGAVGLVLFHVIQLVADSILLRWIGRRRPER